MSEKKPTVAEQFQTMLEEMKRHDSYHVEAAKVELSEQIYLAMESAGVTEADLARRISASRAYINKVLQGSTNFTIESLVKIGRALGQDFKFEFVPNAVSELAVESKHRETKKARARPASAIRNGSAPTGLKAA